MACMHELLFVRAPLNKKILLASYNGYLSLRVGATHCGGNAVGVPVAEPEMQWGVASGFDGIPCHRRNSPLLLYSTAGGNSSLYRKKNGKQEGKIFQSWYTESALKITGGLLVHQGDAHRYLKNLARNIFGPESLREELVHEIDLVTQKHLSLWHASNEVNVKEATEIMLFELAAKMLMGLDEAKASELRQNYKHFKESFVSFPLNIPGFDFHSVIQGKKRALEIIRETIVERRRSKENHKDFLS